MSTRSMKISEHVLTQLARTDPNATEKTWCALYNALLYTLFPVDEHFLVVPLPEPIEEEGVIASHTYFRVNHTQDLGTVFLLQIRERTALDSLYGRELANDAIRRRILELLEQVAIPKLFAVSMMGTRFAVHEFFPHSGLLKPSAIAHKDGEVLTDVAPARRWEYDILEAAGQKKLEELVTQIKQMCESGGDTLDTIYADEDSSAQDYE